jgi:hypothetical protein
VDVVLSRLEDAAGDALWASVEQQQEQRWL